MTFYKKKMDTHKKNSIDNIKSKKEEEKELTDKEIEEIIENRKKHIEEV